MSNPIFIIVAGCAGAGKTTLAKDLANKLNLAFVDKDTVCGDFTDLILTKTGGNATERESELYTKEVRPMEYLSTFKVCKDILDCGKGVVLAIPFIAEIQDYNKWIAICNAVGMKSESVLVVWIEHNETCEHENLLQRNSLRDKNKLDNWEDYCKGIADINTRIDRNYAVVFHRNHK